MTLTPKISLRLWLLLSVNVHMCQSIQDIQPTGRPNPLKLFGPDWSTTCGVQCSKDILILTAEIDLIQVKADLEAQGLDRILSPVMNRSTSMIFLYQNKMTQHYNVLCMQFVGVTTKVKSTDIGCHMTEYEPNKMYKIALNQMARFVLSDVKVKVAWKQEDYDDEYAYVSDTTVTFPRIFKAYEASLTIGDVTKEGRVPSDYLMEFNLDMTEGQTNEHGGGSFLHKKFCVKNLMEPFTLSATLYERSLYTMNDPYDPSRSTAEKSSTNQDCLDLTEWQLMIPTTVFILTLREDAGCGRSATFEHIIQHSQSGALPTTGSAGDVMVTIGTAGLAYALLWFQL